MLRRGDLGLQQLRHRQPTLALPTSVSKVALSHRGPCFQGQVHRGNGEPAVDLLERDLRGGVICSATSLASPRMMIAAIVSSPRGPRR